MMNAIALWIETHPTIFALVLWPTLTALLTSVFSKPSDAFAARYPRLAAIRRIPSDAGINLPKLLSNVLVAITGKPSPSPAPEAFPDEGPTKKEGRSIPPLPVLFMALAISVRVIVVLLALSLASGCHEMTPAEKAAAADTAYKAEIVACATKAATRAEGEACIADVDRRWSQGVADAGADR